MRARNISTERDNRILFALVILHLSFLSGCSVASQTLASRNHDKPPAPIAVHVFDVKASQKPAESFDLIPAAVSVRDSAVVLAERDGRLIQVAVDEGSHVQKGDVLAGFNDEDQRNQLQQAELDVSRLRVEGQQFEAMVKLSRSEFDREVTLAKDGLSSAADVERAQYKLEQSIHESEKARLATESAVARLAIAKLELEKCTIRAPIAGVVTRRYPSVGTSISKNDKLFEVGQLFNLELRFKVPQTMRGRLHPGQLLEITTLDNNSITGSARIRRNDPVADATTDTFGYVADIVTPSNLTPGLSINVHLPQSQKVSTFWLPRAVLVEDTELQAGSTQIVLALDGNSVTQRTVRVATSEGDQVEIASGLTEGDRIILTPPSSLKAGDKVEVRSD